jgi:hypothetical protein
LSCCNFWNSKNWCGLKPLKIPISLFRFRVHKLGETYCSLLFPDFKR